MPFSFPIILFFIHSYIHKKLNGKNWLLETAFKAYNNPKPNNYWNGLLTKKLKKFGYQKLKNGLLFSYHHLQQTTSKRPIIDHSRVSIEANTQRCICDEIYK